MWKRDEVNLSNKFRIFETAQFLKDLDKNFSSRRVQIEQKLRKQVYLQLQIQPYFGRNIKKLKSYTPSTWRYRIGDYRFFYEIGDQEKIVFMISADNRQDAY